MGFRVCAGAGEMSTESLGFTGVEGRVYMCSRKCAEPLDSAVSYREPDLMKTPTHTLPPGDACVATRIPFESVVTWMQPPGQVGGKIHAR